MKFKFYLSSLVFLLASFMMVNAQTKTVKGTSIGRKPITSTMNKHKRRQQGKGKYRGQGK